MLLSTNLLEAVGSERTRPAAITLQTLNYNAENMKINRPIRRDDSSIVKWLSSSTYSSPSSEWQNTVATYVLVTTPLTLWNQLSFSTEVVATHDTSSLIHDLKRRNSRRETRAERTKADRQQEKETIKFQCTKETRNKLGLWGRHRAWHTVWQSARKNLP